MHEESTKDFEAQRIVTDDSPTQAISETCSVAIEAPLTLDIADVGRFTVLCTPADKRAMSIGFMFSEGIIDKTSDIAVLGECEDDPGTIRVRLNEKAKPAEGLKRNMMIASSCGACGSEDLDGRMRAMPRVPDGLRIRSAIFRKIGDGMRRKQSVFEKTGGAHAIGLFDSQGEILSFAEDIGRHNALDKAIGKLLIAGRGASGLGAFMSGRISMEMIAKCARAGIEIACAVSAPTSLALEAAIRCNITVLAFVREARATVFTFPHRIAV